MPSQASTAGNWLDARQDPPPAASAVAKARQPTGHPAASTRSNAQTQATPAASAGNKVRAERQAASFEHRTLTAGADRMGVRQARRNTSVPLVPPKPKLFFTATSIFMALASLAQ